MAPESARMLFVIAATFAIFYFVLWRPQAAQRKKLEQQILAIKRGDEIVTIGGIVGQVVHIQEAKTGAAGMDDRIKIKSGDSTVVVERGRIARVASAAAPASTATSA